jgi:pectinesterase
LDEFVYLQSLLIPYTPSRLIFTFAAVSIVTRSRLSQKKKLKKLTAAITTTKMRSLILLSSLLITSVHATTSPPNGALIVGVNAQYKNLQSAVTAASPGKTIFIQPGTYNEQVYIPPEKKNLVIIGYSENGGSYNGNKVTITQSLAQDKGKDNEHTATLRAWGDGLKVYNVNFVNSRGQGSQALALAANGDRMGFYGCQFKGFQDTIMSERGMHFISKSLIVGATDFIFGQHGILWIEKSTIQVVNAQLGYVTGTLLLPFFLPSAWSNQPLQQTEETKQITPLTT